VFRAGHRFPILGPVPAARTVEISYLPGQGRLLQCASAHILCVAGVASGKTEGGARWVLQKAIQEPDVVGFIGAQTHAQLARISLPPLLRLLSESGLAWVLGRTPPAGWGTTRFPPGEHGGILSIRVPGAARPTQIITGSMENYNAHRGLSVGWYWLDEARDMAEEAYDVILSRLRGQPTDRYGGILTTTPNGFGWLHKRFIAEPVLGSGIVRMKTSENPFLPAGFLEGLRSQYTERFAKQELDGEFLNMTAGQIYYAFSRANNVGACPTDPRQPLWFSMDFNVSPLCAIYGHSDKKSARVTGEVHIVGSGRTADAVEEFCRRHAGHQARQVIVYGDRNGANRDTRSNTTDYGVIEEVLKANKFAVDLRRNYSNPSIVDSVEAVNGVLEHRHVTIDPSCKHLISDLEQVAWKEGTREVDKSNPALTHTSDAFRYFIAKEFPLPSGKAHVANFL
jgi:hypothetical protein